MKSKTTNRWEGFMKGVFLLSALLAVFSLVMIIVFIFANGLPFMLEYGIGDFIFGTEWAPTNDWSVEDPSGSFGILPMIVGSIYVTIGAVIIGVPIGILTSIYLAEFAPPKIKGFLTNSVSLMAAIPSVVYGFFGMQVFVPWIRETFGGPGFSMLAAMLVLGIMILPTIINLSVTSIEAVPRVFYNGGVALGATHERSVFTIVIPAARSGIISSVILGVGRAIGETMAVQLVAGNQPTFPDGLTDGVRTLTANVVLEMAYASGTHREALISTAVILFIFILIINGVFLVVKNRGESY